MMDQNELIENVILNHPESVSSYTYVFKKTCIHKC